MSEVAKGVLLQYYREEKHFKLVILNNQRDATHTMFFIISALHVWGGFSAGVDGLEQPIHTSGRQQGSMTITKAAHTIL
jgi:hypothetical protein